MTTGHSDPDNFESAVGSAGDAGTFKYYQVVVPDFTFNATGDDKKNKGGSDVKGTSFIRLGGFPTVGDGSTYPPGFKSSLKLAKLVGKKVVHGKDEPPATYAGDSNYLLGFADDTRFRHHHPEKTLVNTHVKDNDPHHRQKETEALLVKGGWWDHSDGNRISTTAGDKIEIIQGNYKMVVLGRQPLGDPAHPVDPAILAANALIRDVSGGMVEENGPSPTHCIKTIEFTQDEHKTWSVYQNNGDGNVYSSFYGDTGDLFIGQHQETWKGQAPGGFPQSTFYANSMRQRALEGSAPPPPDPDIRENTWANSIVTYTGSPQKWIPTIDENTYAKKITSTTHAEVIEEETHAKRIKSETIANAVTSVTTAAEITDVQIAANKFSFTAAIQENLALPLTVNVSLFTIDAAVGKLGLSVIERNYTVFKEKATVTEDRIAAIENALATAENRINNESMYLTNVENRIANEMDALAYRATRLEVETVHMGGEYDCWYGETRIGFG